MVKNSFNHHCYGVMYIHCISWFLNVSTLHFANVIACIHASSNNEFSYKSFFNRKLVEFFFSMVCLFVYNKMKIKLIRIRVKISVHQQEKICALYYTNKNMSWSKGKPNIERSVLVVKAEICAPDSRQYINK